jgi:hypothetical protein
MEKPVAQAPIHSASEWICDCDVLRPEPKPGMRTLESQLVRKLPGEFSDSSTLADLQRVLPFG